MEPGDEALNEHNQSKRFKIQHLAFGEDVK